MRTLAATLLLLRRGLAPRPAAAQWGLSAEIGVARFGGTSRDTAGTRVGPYRPTTFALRVDRALGSARVALAVLYAKTGFAGERNDVAVVQYDVGSLWEFAPETRSEEHTSELQSRFDLVCRLLLEKKKK